MCSNTLFPSLKKSETVNGRITMLAYFILLSSCCFIYVSPSTLPSEENIFQITKLERELLVFLKSYIEKKSHWITIIKWELKDLLKEVPEPASGTSGIDEYVGHALNQFHLVRRLDRRWRRLLALANTTTVLNRIKVEFAQEMPNFESYLNHTIKNILKLQNIYNLSIKSLSSGYIGDSKSYGNMTADDCLTIGCYYFHNTLLFDDAVRWLDQSLAKLNVMDQSTRSAPIKEYIFLSKCFKGDQEAAMAEYRNLIETEALFLPSESLREEYTLAFRGCKKAAEELHKSRGKLPMRMTHKGHENLSDPVCRGWVVPPVGLRCRLITYGKPHLRLAPLKLEEMYIDPPVIVFHDVLTDKQADAIKKRSMQHLKVSVLETRKASLERQSESAIVTQDWPEYWLIRQKTEMYTGASLQFSERPQVGAYGPGGEYGAHYDHLQHDFGPSHMLGIRSNRLATFMFYIDDVKGGGYTGFPFLDIRVKPKKGSALFWFNTYRDCSLDRASVHNACPVALGTKTVVTQWILKAGNEFTWPCSLQPRSTFKYFYL